MNLLHGYREKTLKGDFFWGRGEMKSLHPSWGNAMELLEW